MSVSKIKVWLEANALPGLTPKTFRHHYSLWPIYFCIVSGLAWSVVFSARTVIFNPDSMFQGPHYYEHYRDGKYFKFMNVSGVVLPCKAPIYRREGDPSDESYALPEY